MSNMASPSRHRSRELAFQMVYQWDLTRGPAKEATDKFIHALPTEHQTASRSSKQENDSFANELFDFVRSHIEQIDELINAHSVRWRIDRMSAVDRSILRLAVAELIDRSTASAVIIDEAIRVGIRFSTQDAKSFLNGVLDAIRKHLEEQKPSAKKQQELPR